MECGALGQFPVAEQAKIFAFSEGVLLALGKCMAIHGVDESEFIKLSNMEFFYQEMVKAYKILNY